MILWTIQTEDKEWEIEVGPVTILKGSSSVWYKLIRDINDYFNNKQSTVKIFEDTQPIFTKDWECTIIPYDANLQIEKLNSKSPLKFLMDDVIDELRVLPAVNELISLWEELEEEIYILNDKVNQYDLSLFLKAFDVDHLRNFISFQSKNSLVLPAEYKKLLLKLLVERKVEKKRLVIIELPELFANDQQLVDIFNFIEKAVSKGSYFIIVTDQPIVQGSFNYIVKDKVLNKAVLEKIKRKVFVELPFVCDDQLYNEARISLLKAVDKSGQINLDDVACPFNNHFFSVLKYVILRHVEIDITLDTKGFPPNLDLFVKSYAQ